MRLAVVANIVSPHQMPLARELAKRLGSDCFRYVATQTDHAERKILGWGEPDLPPWVLLPGAQGVSEEARSWIRDADVVLCGSRDLGLFEARTRAGKLTFYMSERWFKPPIGILRLLHSGYLAICLRLFRLARSPFFYYLPMGIHATHDMRRLLSFLDRLLQVNKELPQSRNDAFPRMFLWGYFVDPSDSVPQPKRREGALRILWVGRMVGLKRVDTLIRAAAELVKIGKDVQLTLVGYGIQEKRLKKTIKELTKVIMHLGNDIFPAWITFRPPVPIVEVRGLMREADVYVLSSNGSEGWGAVVNEAMQEGCAVIGTHEAGSSATLIQDGKNGMLFHAGDVKGLTRILACLEADEALRLRLAKAGQETMIKYWVSEVAAERLLKMADTVLAGRTADGYASGPLMSV